MSSVFWLQQVCVARLRAILNLGLLEITSKDVRGKTGEPRLELVSGRAKAAEYFQIAGLKEFCPSFGHFVDDLCQDYGNDRNRQADAVDITLH